MRAINVGKKSSEKSTKNVFLYSHQYRDQKNGWTKREKQFFQKHTISGSKKWKKYRLKKVRKKVFLYSHEYRDQKKTRETLFSETHE